MFSRHHNLYITHKATSCEGLTKGAFFRSRAVLSSIARNTSCLSIFVRVSAFLLNQPGPVPVWVRVERVSRHPHGIGDCIAAKHKQRPTCLEEPSIRTLLALSHSQKPCATHGSARSVVGCGFALCKSLSTFTNLSGFWSTSVGHRSQSIILIIITLIILSTLNLLGHPTPHLSILRPHPTTTLRRDSQFHRNSFVSTYATWGAQMSKLRAQENSCPFPGRYREREQSVVRHAQFRYL
ncbi:hypothetical protein P153DRAFT_205304 [Dothidotthia symphoricarpi CBS 119687]|uniref:Uncharacterized protein n=1 Tax=Dothidotthia symphoricarpi CBS 119687 TaxID=1392245 RepID=A0A6A6AI78_9PLEO|nr:uncharacterized protein P153DRAFT_205304 [Dothidotthia symphoricarpi CBS 119687]KAF2130815.1 hypothetical protein P153DRAFT_205304 [Dothidotthia symphoricarpi CBS 119687]